MADDFRNLPAICRDDSDPTRHIFEELQWRKIERVIKPRVRRQSDIELPNNHGHIVMRDGTCEDSPVGEAASNQTLLQFAAQLAFTDNDKAQPGMILRKTFGEFGQQCHAVPWAQAADDYPRRPSLRMSIP